jgi:hypothetical protein
VTLFLVGLAVLMVASIGWSMAAGYMRERRRDRTYRRQLTGETPFVWSPAREAAIEKMRRDRTHLGPMVVTPERKAALDRLWPDWDDDPS